MNKIVRKVQVLLLCMLFALQVVSPISSVHAATSNYDKVYTGIISEPISLISGKYLFRDVIIRGDSEKADAISVLAGQNVTLIFEGKNYLYGRNADRLKLGLSGRSGAGILVPEDAEATIKGEAGSILNVYGGNASSGENGANGKNAPSEETAGAGGAGGRGGHGASAAIGGHGGSTDRAAAAVQQMGTSNGAINILGELVINASGGRGGKGGNGGSGGTSHGNYEFFTAKIASGGGGGGGGGGGYPAPAIGGGGSGGANGGAGGGGARGNPSSMNPSMAMAGAGGGGGAGFGGGGGGGTGCVAYYGIEMNQTFYDKLNLLGGAGGDGYATSNTEFLSPDSHKNGGYGWGILHDWQNHRAYGYLFKAQNELKSWGSVSASDFDKNPSRYIETSYSASGGTPTTSGERATYLNHYQVGSSSTSLYDVSGIKFAKKDGGNIVWNEQAFSGASTNRQYWMWLSQGGGENGASTEYLTGGAAKGSLTLSENVIINADNIYDNGSGVNSIPPAKAIKYVYDISVQGTKIKMTPESGVYDAGKNLRPKFEVTSASGVAIDPDAYTVSIASGDETTPGEVVYKFSGKGLLYSKQFVVGQNEVRFPISKAEQKIYVEPDVYSVEQGQNMVLNIRDLKLDTNQNIEWEITSDPNVTFTQSPNNVTNQLSNITGLGKIRVKVKVSESTNYKAITTDEIEIDVEATGADRFNITGLTSQVYTGEDITTPFEVFFGSEKLDAGEDYDFKFSNNRNVGLAKVEITGKGSYTGTKTGYFNITVADISNVKFENVNYDSGSGVMPSLTYNNSFQNQALGKGQLNGIVVNEGVDFTVVYDNTLNAGDAKVKIVGKGNYGGGSEVSYAITPADLATIEGINVQNPANVVYNGSPQESQPRVIQNGMLLTKDTDYTLSYSNYTDVGTASVIITGKGNYQGNLETNYEIIKKPIYIKPTKDLYKYPGDADPEFTYVIDGTVNGDVAVVKAGGKLERMAGEDVSNYPIMQGSVALDSEVDVNKNYTLMMDSELVNFEVKDFDIQAEATIEGEFNADTDWYTGQVTMVAPDDYLIAPSNTEGETWSDSMKAGDGDYSKGYTYYLKVKDGTNQGRMSRAKTIAFKQDSEKVNPSIKINDKKVYKKVLDTDKIKFKNYFGENITVTLNGEDATSGIEKIQYYSSETPLSDDEIKALRENDWTTKGSSESDLVIDTEGKFIIYERIIDKAGNISYASSDGMILDKEKPGITLTYDFAGIWSGANASVDVSVDEDLSGIKERYFDYYLKYSDGRESDRMLLAMDENGKATIDKLIDGEYDIVVNARDNSDNLGEASVSVKKDTQKPIVYVDGDVEKIAAYKDIDLQTIVGSSGVKSVYLQRQEYGKDYVANGTWIDVSDQYKNNQKIRVDENGTYYVKYINQAGVTSNIADISFNTIDKVKPVLNIKATSGKNPISDGEWTKNNVVVTMSNQVTNIGETEYYYRYKRSESTTFGEWQKSMRNQYEEGQIEFSNTGTYDIECKVISAAGLESDSKTFQAAIDKTAPKAEVEMEGKKSNSLLNTLTFNVFFNESKVFTITGNDGHSKIGSIEYFLAKDDSSKEVQDKDSVETFARENGGWKTGALINNTLGVQISSSASYVLYAKVIDKVGNISYVCSDGVIVDKEAPTITVDSSIIQENGWIVDPNATLPITIKDALSGPDKITYQENGNTEELDGTSGNANIENFVDGTYNMDIVGYDKAKNSSDKKSVAIKKDTVPVDVKLEGDTVAIGSSKQVSIEPVVGVSGLKKLQMKFVKEGQKETDVSWKDITGTYANGYKVEANGVLVVEIENQIGGKKQERLTFTNIKYVEPVVKVDTIDEDDQVVYSDAWYSAIRIRFYNDPIKVSDFVYSYRVDNGPWTMVTPIDGFAYITALNGNHTYEVKTTNNTPGETPKDSTIKSITAKVDAKKPTGKVSISDTEQWSDDQDSYEMSVGKQDPFAIKINDVSEEVDGSGLKSIEYYVYSSIREKRLENYPKTQKEMKEQLQDKWLPLTAEQIVEAQSSDGFQLEQAEENREYMVFVKITDISGNSTYIGTPGISISKSKPVISTTYDGEWITDNTEVRVDINDILSVKNTGEYQVNHVDTGTISYDYTLSDNQWFMVDTTTMKEGVSNIGIKAENTSGIVADDFSFSVNIDRVKPQINVNRISFDDVNKALIEMTPTVGASGLKHVEITDTFGNVKRMSDYGTGYEANRNGTYTFTAINNAGVRSDSVKVDINDLGEPPRVNIKATNEDGTPYVSGTWTNQTVDIQVAPKYIIEGNNRYEYSEDGETWDIMNPDSVGEYHQLISEDGNYTYYYRITNEAGAASEVEIFNVHLDRSKPEYDLEVSNSDPTNQTLQVKVKEKNLQGKWQYSFDNGVTYGDVNYCEVDSNQYVNVVVKNQSGTTTKDKIKVSNIDKMSPLASVLRKDAKTKGEFSLALKVEDTPENVNYAMSGVSVVYLTAKNPYVDGSINLQPTSQDTVFAKNEKGEYIASGQVSDALENTTSDNAWIVASDKAGNAVVRSIRIDPSGKVDENPGGDIRVEEVIFNKYIERIIEQSAFDRKSSSYQKMLDNEKVLKEAKEELKTKQKSVKLLKNQIKALDVEIANIQSVKMNWILVYLAIFIAIGSVAIYGYKRYRLKKGNHNE